MGNCFKSSSDDGNKRLLNNQQNNGGYDTRPQAAGQYEPPKIASSTDNKTTSKKKSNVQQFKLSKKVTIDDFETVKCIGKGSFAKVMMVKKKDTGDIYAMKCLTKKDLVKRKQIQHTMTEREVISNIKHPFIVSLHFAFQTDTKLYLVTDFFNGGELFWHLKNENNFTETRARFYAAEIVLALECLHESGIVYRDMKPENLLLDADGHIRLTDFGLSKDSLHGNAVTKTFCGTPEYLAPEVVRQEPYGTAVDWWALGVLIFEMLHGLPPFYNKNLREMYHAILNNPIPFPVTFSQDVQEIISGLMERNPKNRLGYNGAQEVKESTWFVENGIDFVKLYKKELPVPYKPKTAGDDDFQNVDDEFLDEDIADTYVETTGSMLEATGKFPGFTYVEKDEI